MKRKGKVIGVLSVALMMSMVAVLSANTKTEANACFFKKNVTIYTGNANADGFDTSKVKIRPSAKNIVKALQSKEAVASDVKVNSFKDGGANLTLDLNLAYAQDVATSGTAGEYIKVGCVVNTFLDAYDATNITITVEGKSWETGHSVYDAPLQKYKSNAVEVTEAKVYVGNANADGFDVKTVSIQELNADTLMDALKSNGAVANGVVVNSFKQDGGVVALDLNSAFANDVCSYGTAGEYIKIGSVVNTFLDAFNAQKVQITIDGQVFESGHAIYDEPMGRFN